MIRFHSCPGYEFVPRGFLIFFNMLLREGRGGLSPPEASVWPPRRAVTLAAISLNAAARGEEGLLTDVEMEKAGNLRQGVHLRRFFFESADQEHLAIEGE